MQSVLTDLGFDSSSLQLSSPPPEIIPNPSKNPHPSPKHFPSPSEIQIFPAIPESEQLPAFSESEQLPEQLAVKKSSLSSILNSSDLNSLEPTIDNSLPETSLPAMNEEALHDKLYLLPTSLHEDLIQSSSSFDPNSSSTSNCHLNSPTLSLMTSPIATNHLIPSISSIGKPDLSSSSPSNIKPSVYSSFEFPILPGQSSSTNLSPANPPSIPNSITTLTSPDSISPTPFPATFSPVPLFYSRRKKSPEKLNSDILDDIGTTSFTENKSINPALASKTGFAFQPSPINPKVHPITLPSSSSPPSPQHSALSLPTNEVSDNDFVYSVSSFESDFLDSITQETNPNLEVFPVDLVELATDSSECAYPDKFTKIVQDSGLKLKSLAPSS